MKLLPLSLLALPAFAAAHESDATSSVGHAVEHNLANPYIAVATIVVLAVAVQLVRKVFAH